MITRGQIIFLLTVLSAIFSTWKYQVKARGGKLKLFLDSEPDGMEVASKQCKAGVILTKPTVFTCACVTGVWGFYKKYCHYPWLIVGGDNFCFKLEDTLISQVILFGNHRYPFQKSLTHFTDQFRLRLKAYVTDNLDLDLDTSATFLSVTADPWTLTSVNGEKVCLLPATQTNSTDPRQFCIYDITKGNITKEWKGILEIHRGCNARHSIEAEACEEIHPPNDEASCSIPIEPVTKPPTPKTTQNPEWNKTTESHGGKSTTDSPKRIVTLETTPSKGSQEESTRPRWDDYESGEHHVRVLPAELIEEICRNGSFVNYPLEIQMQCKCKIGFNKTDVQDYWLSNETSVCPKSITEVILTDQLKRFAVLQMNQLIRTRQVSLQQTEELLGIMASLFKKTCPKEAVSSEFVDVVVEAFTMFIRDDFFYGVEETEGALFENIVYDLKTCVNRALTFEFIFVPGKCPRSQKIDQVVFEGIPHNITITERNSWKNYEIIIESVWKMFLNMHSYCFQDFIRQNDHHYFAIRMMQLFSRSIYEKWIQPLSSRALYKFILPQAYLIDETMDNLDKCVGVLNYEKKCPVWLDRDSVRQDVVVVVDPTWKPKTTWKPQPKPTTTPKSKPRPPETQIPKPTAPLVPLPIPPSQIEKPTQYYLFTPRKFPIGSAYPNDLWTGRRKRSIWKDHFEHNREITEIWGKSAYCLQTPEDPSFLLGFGRCAHP